MKYISLNYSAIASDIRPKIDDEEVQRITIAEDYMVIQLVIDKTLVRSLGSNCWRCNVVSAHLFTTDGELLGAKLFGFDEMNDMIGLVETNTRQVDVVRCPQCGSTSTTKAHRAGTGQVFKCSCGNGFVINLE